MSGLERFERLSGSMDAETGLKSQSVRGGAYTMIGEGIDFVLRLGSIAVLARLLLPEHFGLIGMVTAITVVAERFKDLGLSIVTVQRERITHDEVTALFWVNAALGAVASLIIAALAVPISAFYGDERLVHITLAIAVTFVWGGLSIQHLALLRRTMRFGRIAAINIGASAASIVIAIVLALYGFGYWALVAREVSRSVLIAIATWVCCPWVPGAPRLEAGALSMVKFGGHLTAVQLASLLSTNLGQVLIGRFFDARPLGLYRQGVQLVLAPITQLKYPIYMVGESALSRLQMDPERYRRYFRKFVTVLSAATMPLSAFVLVQAENIVLLVLGPTWIEAAPYFRILAIATFLYPTDSAIGAVMVTCGQSRKYFVLGMASAGVLALFSLVGIFWGPLGIAAAHIAALYVMLLPRLYFGFKDTPVGSRLFFAAIGRPASASLAMAVVLEAIKAAAGVEGVLASIALAMGAGAVSFLAAWLVVPGGWLEMRDLLCDITDSLGLPFGPKRETS
jgi:O-antigen/teichoic acid export membrane protein